MWEYINPVTQDGIKTVIPDNYPMYNSVFRAYRYTSDYSAFQGRTLTKTKTITGAMPQYFKPSDLISGIGSSTTTVPQEFVLHQNYPNPFNPSTVISYQLPVTSHVDVRVYDVLGREIAVLVNQEMPAGTHSATWNAANLPSGLYVCRLTTGSFMQARKMLLTK